MRVPLAVVGLLAQLGDEPDLVAVQIGELEELNDPFKALQLGDRQTLVCKPLTLRRSILHTDVHRDAISTRELWGQGQLEPERA